MVIAPGWQVVRVAPHAGAWIETYQLKLLESTEPVAPHAGAWIETLLPWKISKNL